MEMNEKALDLAEARIEGERAAGVSAGRLSLVQSGTDACIDCDRAIPQARRKAAPFAKRCIGCQSDHEKSLRRSA